MKVSIIMPAHNAEAHIQTAIDSTLAQSFEDFELLVLDDCSTDRTVEIVEAYTDSRIQLHVLETNLGAAETRNYGIRQAKGRYLAFLDSDDCWKPEKLAVQLAFMEENQAALSYTAYDVMSPDGAQITGRVNVPESVTYRYLLRNTIIGCLTVMIDTEQTGLVQMPAFKGAEDTATWLTILKKGHVGKGITDSLAFYRKGNVSLSSNKLQMAKLIWSVYRKNQNMSVFMALTHFPFYLWNGFVKHLRTGGSVKLVK
ncbi:glycosyltransferase family 2 protein [Listeria booriae]|uniref:Glycosyltransferase family 2 protein n=1 Tax=Listeria booriae TaxID=1552123 RepID=A0A7X0Z8B5_9LIST|nr:glycosyltransferase family 2 protein [Listeria booriae]MBC2177763.1 glycosyltransferase family 2 protein [Listeria booriae]MBC2177816.1 glycosyltransferase family 2 protein [Listeria booriae]